MKTDNDVVFTWMELCELCHQPPDLLISFVEYEIIRPQGAKPDQWVFDTIDLHRAKRALRLQRDLEMNLASIALVLELLEELDQLRTRAALWEKHLLK